MICLVFKPSDKLHLTPRRKKIEEEGEKEGEEGELIKGGNFFAIFIVVNSGVKVPVQQKHGYCEITEKMKDTGENYVSHQFAVVEFRAVTLLTKHPHLLAPNLNESISISCNINIFTRGFSLLSSSNTICVKPKATKCS